MLQKINPYRDGITLTDCVDVLDPIQSKIFCFSSDGGGGGGSSSSVDDPYGVGDSGEFSTGSNNNFSSGGSSDSGNDDNSGSSGGTTFGVDGVSKTGSTAADAAIGWTSGSGSGQPGNNYDALQNATTSEVDYARSMADQGASVGQIATFLNTGTDPFATAQGGTANQGSSVGSVIQGVTQQVIGQAGYTSPSIAKRSFDNTSGTLTGGVSGAAGAQAEGFANEAFESGVNGDVEFGEIPSQSLERSQRQQDLQERLDRRGDYATNVTGIQPALIPGTSIGNRPGKFYQGSGESNPSKERAFDTTNSGLMASESGAFGLLDKAGMKELGEQYGVPGLENMNPRAQMVNLSQIFSANPDIKIGRADQKLGGQAVVRNQQIVDYNPQTGSFMVEGGSKGFLGSDLGKAFSFFAPAGAFSTALGFGGTANNLRNAQLDKDTASIFGTVGEVLGVPIGLGISGLDYVGVDLNRFLPQLSDSRARNRSVFTEDTGGDGNTGGVTAPQNISQPINNRRLIPDTAATGLLRRKRLPGSDVYGVTTNDFPFLAMSDELNVSGLGGGKGRGRSGRIQQNRGR
tara:strand:- start:621 stop:2339 length:1719 start_codon:yes stop_codon:yes gene_type:complete